MVAEFVDLNGPTVVFTGETTHQTFGQAKACHAGGRFGFDFRLLAERVRGEGVKGEG